MTDKEAKISTGGCYCGAVQYQVKGPLRGVVNCHCGQCTRLNGNYGSHSKARKVNISITKDEGLTWFQNRTPLEEVFAEYADPVYSGSKIIKMPPA